MRARRFVRALWVLVGLVTALLFAKFFLADVYAVGSESMRPTLFGGSARPGAERFTEWVLVAYDRSPEPERFDLVVFQREGRAAVVKRVVGLPGESVRIADGDLLIDGARLGPAEPRPAPIPVFSDALLAVEDYFYFKSDPEGPWRRDDEIWVLDASTISPGKNEGMMFYNPEIRDDYLDEEHRRVVGRRTVNDVVLELEFALDQPRGRLRFQLVEKSDTFEARILSTRGSVLAGDFDTSHVFELVRRSALSLQEADPEHREELIARRGIDLELHAWNALSFSNVDNALVVSLPGSDFDVTSPYDANELRPGIPEGADQSVGPRVSFGGEGLRARFRSIRILRDLHHTAGPPEGYAVTEPVSLAPDEVFLLGDNSLVSNDSRAFGPVRLEELVGHPLAVVWPSSRWRRLEETRPRIP
jgi:signal peptidase I